MSIDPSGRSSGGSRRGNGNKSGVSEQVISLPSGGGELEGTGGSYMTNLQTGAGNHTIPIDVPDGRNGMQPDIALSYSSGNSLGIAGMGWSLGAAAISRKTTDGVPIYNDSEDSFILQGGAELVATDQEPTDNGPDWTRYRPRSDTGFPRITHCQNGTTDHWVVESKDGSVSYYGTPDSLGSDPAVVADPDNRTNIFAWYLTATEDSFGNRIEYEYRRDTGETDEHFWDNLSLDQIRYVDYETANARQEFLVSVGFEYDERPDPNSTYTAGFEQRTRERLSRIVVRTHADRERTIRRYELTYRDELPDGDLPANGASILARVEVVGHDDGETERMPPVEFEYSRFNPRDREFEELDGPLPRRSLAAPELELADLSGNGLPDIVEIDDVVQYWQNLGEGEFDEPRHMTEAPAGLSLAKPEVQMMDADGDSRIDLVSFAQPMAGYFPLERDGGWSRDSFRGYDRVPSVDIDAPEVQLLDLDGDGVTDMLRTGNSIECFFQDPEDGWYDVRTVPSDSLDGIEEIDFADPRIRFADISADGLQDIIMVSDGHVSYWPNLGHGNWGRRVWMRNPPDLPRDYDPGRIVIGDVDGDGLADLVYVEDDQVTLWMNQCGNSWSEPIEVRGTPSVTDTDAIRLMDIKGTGIGGLLYSGGDQSTDDEMYYLDFINGQKPYLMTETRNGLGSSVRLEYAPSTEFYLRDDRETDGWKTTLPQPTWVVSKEESLDFVSQKKLTSEYRYHHGHWDGVEQEFRGFGKVEQRDTESFEAYNSEGLHGDREFAQVTDTEHFSPPTLTKTWFHVGPVGPEHGPWRELTYEDEYWVKDPSQLSRPGSTRNLLERLRRRDCRDAVRTLAGNKLRTEVYALDDSPRENRPFRVTEYQYGIREEGPPRAERSDRKPIFFPHPTSTRTTDWERGSDPMARFTFVSDYDRYGQAQTDISIACPQSWRHDRPSPTSEYQATCSTTRYIHEDDEQYMVDRIAQTRSYLIADDAARTVWGLKSAIEDESVTMRLTGLTYHYYDGPAFVGKDRGAVGDYGARVRTDQLVLTDELLEKAYPNASDHSGTGLNPSFPNISTPPDTAGAPSYLTSNSPSWSGEYPEAFRTSVPERAGYVTHDIAEEADLSGAEVGYFAVTNQTEYDFQTDELETERGLVRSQRDPLDRETTILQYDPYDLNPLRVEDPGGLRTQAAFDYSAMRYWRVTGPNGNRSQTEFSPLGRVTARINLGDPNKEEGDTPEQPSVRYEYDYHAFREGPSDQVTPVYVHTIQRKRHRWELVEKMNEERAADGLPPLSDAKIRALFENELEDHPERFVQQRTYMDGDGTAIQTRGQAESEVFTDSSGDSVLPTDISQPPDSTVIGDPEITDEPRVRVSEWRTYNNKGNMVEAFEPFYDAGWAFTSRDETERIHPEAFERKTTFYYDGLDRCFRAVGPDGAETRVVRGDPSPDLSDPDAYEPTPWVQYYYDTVDNAGRTHTGEARSYEHRWNTPTSTHVELGEWKEVTVTRNRQPGETDSGDITERQTVVQYDPWDNTVTATDELGRDAITSLSDLAGNTLRTEDLDAGTSWQCYDAAGSVLEGRDAKGALRLQSIDERGRPTRTWARDETNGSVTLRERVVYGEDAPIDRQTAKERNLLGTVHEGYDESGLVTVDAYDFTGKPEAVRQELLGDDTVAGGPIDWQPSPTETWSDRERTLLSGREYRTSFEHDALGRLRVQRYPDDVRGRAMELHVEYTPSGSLDGAELVVNPGEANEKRERYLEAVGRDSRERPVVKAYGNGVLVRSAYDETTKRLRRQRTESYTKDGSSQRTTRLETTGTVYRDVEYTYDVGGNVLESREEARGVGVAGVSQPTHDGSQLVHGRDTLVRAFWYDAVGQLTQATGRECTSIEQPRKWGDDSPCGFADFEGTPDVGRANAPDQTTMYTEEYDYDPAGNIQSLQHTRHLNGRSEKWMRHFGYAENAPADWDPSPGGGPATPVRLTNVGDENSAVSSPTHEYDDVGNLQTERNSAFEWDHANRLSVYREVKNGSVSVEASYAYASGGQRAKKVVDKGDHQREVIEYVGGLFEYHRLETDRTASNGGTVKENNTIQIAGVARKRVGTPFDGETTFAENDRPAVEYQYSDRTGGTSLVVDGDGSWTNREEYTPFGETTFGGFKRKRYRFMGSERDEESDFYYQGARYYAPWLCRWTTTDPAGPQDGLNLYAYVRNDPVNRSDPTGTQSTRHENESEAYTGQQFHPSSKSNPALLIYDQGPGSDTASSRAGNQQTSRDNPRQPQSREQANSSNQKSYNRSKKAAQEGKSPTSTTSRQDSVKKRQTGGETSDSITASDIWDFGTGLIKGTGNELKNMVTSSVKAVFNPVDTATGLANTTSQSYNEGGGGISGVVNAVNQFNPVSSVLKSGYRVKIAWERGNYEHAGRMSARTGMGVVDTVGVAMGGAGALKKGVTKLGGKSRSGGLSDANGGGSSGNSGSDLTPNEKGVIGEELVRDVEGEPYIPEGSLRKIDSESNSKEYRRLDITDTRIAGENLFGEEFPPELPQVKNVDPKNLGGEEMLQLYDTIEAAKKEGSIAAFWGRPGARKRITSGYSPRSGDYSKAMRDIRDAIELGNLIIYENPYFSD